jgi:hypothetical protein
MTKIWQAFSLPDFIINQYKDAGSLSVVSPMIEKKGIVQTPKIGGLTFNYPSLAIYWGKIGEKVCSLKSFVRKQTLRLVQSSFAGTFWKKSSE